MQSLPNHRLKLQRATKHLHALDCSIKDFTDFEPYEIGSDFDPDTLEYVFLLKSHEHPPSQISLEIGDVLSNLRAALDHLAFAINIKGGPLPDPTKSGFPIYSSATAFAEHAKRNRIPNFGAAETVVEALQPYQGGDAVLLGVLDDLAVIDKHRLLYLTNVVISHLRFEMLGWEARRAFDLSRFHGVSGVLKDGAEILRVGMREPRVPKPEMYVKLDLTCEVCLDHAATTGAQDRGPVPVSKLLHSISKHIKNVVFPKLEPFLV